MAESRITTAFQNLDTTPFNGYMTARLLVAITTTADSQSYVPQEFDFQVVAGQAYNNYSTLEIATLPITSSGDCNPGNTPISLYTKNAYGAKTFYKAVIIPPETGGLPVVLASLVAVAPDSAVAYTNVTNIAPAGIWSAVPTYALGATVTYAGSTWWANQSNTNQTPSDVSIYWNKLFAGIEPTLASTTAASASALTDLYHTVQTGPNVRKVTNSQIFALLDDQAMTWTQQQTVMAAPSASNYGLGVNRTWTATGSNNYNGTSSQVIANPSGVSSGAFNGTYSLATSQAGNANNFTSLYAYRGTATHAANGIVTTAAGMRIDEISNTGFGSITTAYGLFLDQQTAGTSNNFAIRQIGATTPSRFDGKIGIGMTPSNNLDITGTIGATGAATFGSTMAVTGTSYFGVSPTSSANFRLGSRNVLTGTYSTALFEVVANPSSNTGSVWNGISGRAETQAGNAVASTGTPSFRGVAGAAANIGDGSITGMASFYAVPLVNSGAGSVVNGYGLYVADSTAATNNYGIYQAGSAMVNYFQGKLAIGLTAPDATALVDIRGASSQLHLGSASKSGYFGASGALGAYMAYHASYDGANWTQRGSTNAGIYLMSGAAHTWYLDGSGLSDGVNFTPTQAMRLSRLSSGSASILLDSTAPTISSSNAWALAVMPTLTGTSGSHQGIVSQVMANPAANSSTAFAGAYVYSEAITGNAFDFTNGNGGIVGLRANARHSGTGTVTLLASARIDAPTSAALGVVTNAYSLYITSPSISGANNYGLYVNSGQSYFGGAVTIVGASTFTGACVFSGAPTLATAYSAAARRESGSTASVQPAIVGEMVANNVASSAATFTGVYGYAETKTGNNQALTALVGLIGIRAKVSHLGSGVVTASAGVFIESTTNTGGGSITNQYGIYQAGSETNWFAGDVTIQTAGKGLRIKEGSNAKMGQATLSAGLVTVANTSVTATSRIFLTRANGAGTRGFLEVGTIVPGTSFVIESVDSAGNPVADTSLITWQIVEPA